ncbi:hypothetical protein BGX26_008005, partial [Mortierella sp. AD094]
MTNIQALKQRNIKSESDSKTAAKGAAFQGGDFKYGAPPTKIHSAFSPAKTIFRAWASLLGFLTVVVMITYQLHYTLPTPVNEPLNAVNGLAQFSEAN